jgi:hypothetical protein
LAERVFADKLERAGFQEIWTGGYRPFGIDDAALLPLFTPEVISVMRATIEPERHDHVAASVIIKAAKPALLGSGRYPGGGSSSGPGI